MSGKVYTMKEMKNIVTYLIEHQAYGEIRGRKMWVDYANSNATTRTWQSLKETFLKRILPDIHNPYYNLSREQIISFRQGYDVEQRDKIKLEFQPVGDNSKSDTESNKDNDLQIVTSSDEAINQGAVSSRRNGKSSQNQMRRPHNVPQVKDETVSDSSEWTTDTEQDNYISPPRGRKNRMTKKYLKPKSTRILSLEEEGGLFVMYGKRIYPLVKDGRIVKNYVIYESNSDSGFEQDSYWKAKYAELRKKYEERKKSREPSERLREKRPRSVSREPCSPILQSSIRKNPPPAQSHDIHAPSTSKTHPAIEHKEAVTEHPVENKVSSEKIMIKYTINNAEVQLEGHWPQICPIFDKVLDILPKKMEPQNEVTVKNSNNSEVHEQPNVISSGQSTPVIVTGDPVVQEKIDKLESEIFKEIEEKDKEEQIENEKQANTDYVNVTNRKRGRPSKQSTSPGSPNKQPKPSPSKKDTSTQYLPNTVEVNKKQSDVKKSPEVTARRTRRSMKAALDAKDESKPTRGTSKQNTITQETTEEQVRYKFPQNMPQTTNNKIQRPRSFADRIVYQDDDSLIVSESTQGYQDSDISPVKMKKNRKSKRSTIAHRNKLQSKRYQRRTYPYLIQDASTDSTMTSFSGSLKSKISQSSSDIYKSDSYQHLFPRSRLSFNRLEPISEKSPTVNEVEMRPVENVCRNQIYTDSMDSDFLTNDNIGVGSSSSVSLPLSPELSIVEDITMGKELLNSIKDYHSMKDAQANEVIMAEEQNKFLISEVDITIPLMEQKCVLQRNNVDLVLKNSNTMNRKQKTSVSESLLNKIGTVHINDNSSVSDSLDVQLRNLLLESAKKMSKTSESKENNMEVDENVTNTMQKPKAKRRCSTPRKKKETVKSKLPTKTTIEEHLETCSYRGRKSCPPSTQIQNENSINMNEINEDVKNKQKGRKKRDIIKVKILRPRKKSVSKEGSGELTQKASKLSICTDSGINGTESGISFPISNDTVELIHNHSETCLHANECLENSVEFVDASTTLISVNSNSLTTEWQDSRNFKDVDDMSLCSLNNNVKGALPCNNVECIQTYTSGNNNEAIFKSPAHDEILNSSLITEDLSDEAPAQPRVPALPSRWYLLSEEETTNTNIVSPPNSNTGGCGANLNEIFPITCAVPDLSTITEMSKENDSRKPFGLDSFSRDSNSQNIFL
ncbi:uncharacterized protein LOC115444220 isoform X2 [Manduca sexta]|uniref:Rap1 Myb domain-containing protein n=1 Tax=Manduca sexta TaxID=7130 RepID=A0A922CM12_MANSE|nr:uncharacterized protein LOC115444220 isoform X2 [Manduca sexta]KAG6451177.1 hypothetical protein O3G_MSEX006996 [Manduca sexta]